MKNNKQNYIIFADVLSDEVRYLCRRADGSLYTCTVAADANGFYEKDATDVSEIEARIFISTAFNRAMSIIQYMAAGVDMSIYIILSLISII